jgi:hypothetical protein
VDEIAAMVGGTGHNLGWLGRFVEIYEGTGPENSVPPLLRFCEWPEGLVAAEFSKR